MSVTSNLVPAGVIFPYAGSESTPPSGWFICDGTLKVKTDYPELFTALGGESTPYGKSGGSFNLPDLRDKYPVGRSATRARGTTSTAAISANDLAAHSHSAGTLALSNGNISSSGSIGSASDSAGAGMHGHSIAVTKGGNNAAGIDWMYAGTPGTNNYYGSESVIPDYDHKAGSNPSQGIKTTYSGHAHTFSLALSSTAISNSTANNSTTATTYYPPYLAINYIIKY